MKSVLFVDSDLEFLEETRLNLEGKFEVTTASSPDEAFEKVEAHGGFPVIVCGFYLKDINGAQFLSEIKEMDSDSVRVLLSAKADLGDLASALNDGNVYRFLTKPVMTQDLVVVLEDCYEQHHRIAMEKSLLDETLNSVSKAFVDMLNLVSPLAFSRSSRIRKYTQHVLDQLDLKSTWSLKLGAMLSQVGCIHVSQETIKKVYIGEELSPAEVVEFDRHPHHGKEFLKNIPRLEKVAAVIEHQFKPFEDYGEGRGVELSELPVVELGAQILKVANGIIYRESKGMDKDKILEELKYYNTQYNPNIVELLSGIQLSKESKRLGSLKIAELAPEMILAEDVVSNSGMLLISRGQEVTGVMINHINSYKRNLGVKEPIQVYL